MKNIAFILGGAVLIMLCFSTLFLSPLKTVFLGLKYAFSEPQAYDQTDLVE
jgi:hypothetical protein